MIVSICLLGYFSCNNSSIDGSAIEPDDTPADTTAVDTTTIDTVIVVPCSEMPIYYEWDKELFECMNMSRPCDSYNYPMYPGIEGWNLTAFMNSRDTLISKEMASNMTTQALIQAYWEFPMLTDLGFVQYTYFFKNYMLNNNAYNELLRREDAYTALLHRLLLVNHVCCIFNSTDKLSRGGVLAPKALELLISQPEFLARYSDAERKTIIETTLKNDSVRTPLTRILRQTTFFLIGRVLISANYQPFIEELNNNSYLYRIFYLAEFEGSDISNDIIVKCAKQYLEEIERSLQ